MLGKISLANGNVIEAVRRDRSTYIGGSDIAAIMGKNPYKTALDVYNDKIYGETFKGNLSSKAGLHFEDFILDEYELSTGFVGVRDLNVYDKNCSYKGAQVDWLLLNDEKLWVTDAKLRVSSMLENGAHSNIKPKTYEIYQQNWICSLVGAPFADLAILYRQYGQIGFKVETIHYDAVLGKEMHQAAEDFWHYHILPQSKPCVKEVQDDIPMQTNGFTKEVDMDVLELAEKIKLAKERYSLAEKEREELERQMKRIIGAEEMITYAGQPLAKLTTVTQERLDTEKVKAHLGDSYSNFLKSTSYRKLNIL